MEIQRQSEAFAYRLAAPPVSRHYSTKVLQGIHKTAADLVKDYTDNLYKEFHDWATQRGVVPVGFPAGHEDEWDYTKPMGGPLTYWDNIEGFFKERYPEAYRGFNMAEEKARPLMDTGYCGWSDQTRQAKPYETGPEAEAKYGYDPRQLAAGMMYLHTWSHSQNPQTGWRGDKLSRDIDRLSDIFQKRMQMQENARQRKLVNANTIRCATTYYHITDKPDFKLNPRFRPQNNTTLGGDSAPGIYLSRDPEPWLNGYGYWRPYVAEIEGPDDLHEHEGVIGGYGGETYVPAQHFPSLQVKRTIPLDAYCREHYGDYGWTENDFGTDFHTGEPITPSQGNIVPFKEFNGPVTYRYPGTAMDETPEWRKEYQKRVRRFQRSHPSLY